MKIIISDMSDHHLHDVVSLHMEVFGSRIGSRYVYSQMRWLINNPNAIAIIAQVGNQIVGYTVGANRSHLGKLQKALWPVVMRELIFHPKLLKNKDVRMRFLDVLKFRKIYGISKQNGIQKKTVFEQMITAVSKPARGKKIGERLSLAFMTEARKKGANRLSSFVGRNNHPIRQLKEKLGWRVKINPESRQIQYIFDFEPFVQDITLSADT